MKKQPTTHLGNKELHKRHSVMVETVSLGGTIPRAKVMDQMIIDRYLILGLLNLQQHRAGEYLLAQAGRAGIFPTGVNWLGAGGTIPSSHVPIGMMPFGDTLKLVADEWGDFHAKLVKLVICNNLDVIKSKSKMRCLKEALDCIAKRRMGGGVDPVGWIKNRDKKRAAKTGGSDKH
jgi:hypothetical protein